MSLTVDSPLQFWAESPSIGNLKCCEVNWGAGFAARLLFIFYTSFIPLLFLLLREPAITRWRAHFFFGTPDPTDTTVRRVDSLAKCPAAHRPNPYARTMDEDSREFATSRTPGRGAARTGVLVDPDR